LSGPPDSTSAYELRTRYRAPLVKVKKLSQLSREKWKVELDDEVRAVTPGQSAVIYQADRVVGGGIVS
jgi:tRNA U34 2-thiouridine synthase MnmA/TrmU